MILALPIYANADAINQKTKFELILRLTWKLRLINTWKIDSIISDNLTNN